MSLLGRSGAAVARHLGRRGGPLYPGGFWSEGTQKTPQGFLYGETPGPRVIEAWEFPMKLICGLTLASFALQSIFVTGVRGWLPRPCDRDLRAAIHRSLRTAAACRHDAARARPSKAVFPERSRPRPTRRTRCTRGR